MANGKTFADMKKPVRRPTPEQIAAFEETGRARILDPQIGTETRKAAPLARSGGGCGAGPYRSPLQRREHGKPWTRRGAKPETQVSGPVVRRAIDLDEPVRMLFKKAYLMTGRKTVDGVHAFLKCRRAELEGEAGRPLQAARQDTGQIYLLRKPLMWAVRRRTGLETPGASCWHSAARNITC